MPSLSPLSTFKLCRTRDGSRGSVTTACPSAASVGASTTARRSASGQLSAPRSATAAAKPATSVSGRPMPSRRAGTATSPRRARRSMREASAKRTTARVASASACTCSPAGAEVDEPDDLRAQEQADRHEHHRGGQGGARDPAGERCIREQCHRDARECPVHRPTLEPLRRLYPDPARSFTRVNDRRHLTHSARRRTMRGRCTATATVDDDGPRRSRSKELHAGWREQRLRFRPLHLLRSWLVAALALLVAAYILPGAEVKGFLGAVGRSGGDRLAERAPAAVHRGAPAPVHARLRLPGDSRAGRADAARGRSPDGRRPDRRRLLVGAPRRARRLGGHARDRGRGRDRRRQRVLVPRRPADRAQDRRADPHRRARDRVPRDRRARAPGAAPCDAGRQRAAHGPLGGRGGLPADAAGSPTSRPRRARARRASCSGRTRTSRPFAGSRRRPGG